MSESMVLRNSYDKAKAIEQIKSLDLLEPISLVFKKYSGKRTLTANAQQHVWYKQISEFEHCDIRYAGNKSKLFFGLPILLDDPEMGLKVKFILEKIGFYQMCYEQQINVMDLIQVTSLFSTKQHNQYRDNMQMYYFDKGLNLEYKEC